MFKKIITIILIPYNQKKSYNLKIPMAIFYLAIFLLIGAVVLSSLLCSKFRVFSQMKEFNIELSNEVAKINKAVNDVMVLEARLRNLTGSSRETEIAIGSPSQRGFEQLTKGRSARAKRIILSQLEEELEGETMKEASLLSLSPVKRGWVVSKSLRELEVASPPGSVVQAPAKGRILYASGSKIIMDHGNSFETTYRSLGKLKVMAGEVVEKGSIIGYLGRKGFFYQVKKFDKELNPLIYINDYLPTE